MKKFSFFILLFQALVFAQDTTHRLELLGGASKGDLAFGAAYYFDLDTLSPIKALGFETSATVSENLAALNALATYDFVINEYSEIVGKLGLGYENETKKSSKIGLAAGLAYHQKLTNGDKVGISLYGNFFGFNYTLSF